MKRELEVEASRIRNTSVVSDGVAPVLNEQDLREIGGLTEPLGEGNDSRETVLKKVKALDIEVLRYRKEVFDNVQERAVIFKMAEEYAMLRADYPRMRLGQAPRYSVGMLESASGSNLLTYRDRLKRFFKNNFVNFGFGLFSVVSVAFTMAEYLGGGISHTGHVLKHVSDSVSGFFEKLSEMSDAVMSAPGAITKTIMDPIANAAGTFWGGVASAVNAFWGCVNNAANTVWGGILFVASMVMSGVSWVILKISEFITYLGQHLPIAIICVYLGYKIISIVL